MAPLKLYVRASAQEEIVDQLPRPQRQRKKRELSLGPERKRRKFHLKAEPMESRVRRLGCCRPLARLAPAMQRLVAIKWAIYVKQHVNKEEEVRRRVRARRSRAI